MEYKKFLQYCLGQEIDNMDIVVAQMDWQQLYNFAQKQTLIGLCFQGIERIGKEYSNVLKTNPISQDLLMEWIGKSQQIRQLNFKVNKVATQLCSQLQRDQIDGCILKGQGNSLLYPDPYSRTPGDIDLWIHSDRRSIIAYTKKYFIIGDDIRYHHLETSVDNVSVEIHFTPGLINNPLYNARLQKWFQKYANNQYKNIQQLPDGIGTISIPTHYFNAIYQLCHLYHHFFDEGIGLRQIIDYYYVMLHLEKDAITNLQRDLKHLGLWNFAGAVMYLLQNVLNLPEDKMIRHIDQERGELLLKEILEGGNFGKHYQKYSQFTHQNIVKKYFLKIWRNLHFVKYYPSEALSEPLFRTWHFFWRRTHLLISIFSKNLTQHK